MIFSRVVLIAIVAFSSSCVASSSSSDNANDEAMYTALLDQLYVQTDTDGSGALSVTEFSAANVKLGINASMYTQHQGSFANVHAALDANNNGELTKEEFADAPNNNNFVSYRDMLISAFTNGVTDVPADAPVPSDAMNTAVALVTVSMVVGGAPDAIYAGQREQIKAHFATQAGVSIEMVLVTYLLAASGRRLQAAAPAAQTEITATIFMPDAATSDTAVTALSADDLSTAPAFEGVTIVSVSVEKTERVPTLDRPGATLAVVVMLVLAIGLTFNACFWAKRSTRGGTGCFNGCCGLNGIKAWALGELVAAIGIVATMFVLYSNITGVTDSIIGMIEIIIEMATYDSSRPGAEFITDFSASIPSDIIDVLESNLDNIKLMPVATVVPGLLAAIFLGCAAMCSASNGRKGTFCFSRCSMLLAKIFLIVAFVFYTMFAAYAVIIVEAPPAIRESINTIRGICITVPSMINQRLTDGQAAVDRIAAVGSSVNTTEIENTLASVRVIGGFADGVCEHIGSFFDEMVLLFIPGFMCICALLFAFYVNSTLCCAIGCCCSPKGKKTSSTSAPDSKAEVDAVINV